MHGSRHAISLANRIEIARANRGHSPVSLLKLCLFLFRESSYHKLPSCGDECPGTLQLVAHLKVTLGQFSENDGSTHRSKSLLVWR